MFFLNRGRKRMNEVTDEEIRSFNWYYEVELRPGVFTQGKRFPNVALTSRLLSGVKADGLSALDIGAQEGLISVLLARAGADVTIYDRLDLSDRLALVQKAYGCSFETINGIQLDELHAGPFDLVVFSGVLYHMLDPLVGLAQARSKVRNGGLMVIETIASLGDGMNMEFNAGGKLDPTAYFLPTFELLDYLLRFVHLQPLDCLALRTGSKRITRAAIVCRAFPPHEPPDGDGWMGQDKFIFKRDFEHHIDWDRLETGKPPVEFAPVTPDRVLRPGGSVDVKATLNRAEPVEPDIDERRLRLSAKL